jgi:hypothetical protein
MRRRAEILSPTLSRVAGVDRFGPRLPVPSAIVPRGWGCLSHASTLNAIVARGRDAMTKLKLPIPPGPRAVGGRHRWEGAVIPVLAACLMAALTSPSGALARNGTDDAQPAARSVTQSAGAIVVAQWSPPPGATGMELLPTPADPPIAQNGAGGATHPGATRATDFTLSAPIEVTQFMTYHYGAQKPPGTISLQHDDGTVYGPWQAAGAVGQGGVKNAYWWVQPNVELKPGHYLVIDSDPATWSVEDSTQGAGDFILWGHSN